MKLFKTKNVLIETLKEVINSLEENKVLKNKVREQKHNNIILLDNARKDREKIKDLENNIEFLVNNLSPQKKKLVRPEN